MKCACQIFKSVIRNELFIYFYDYTKQRIVYFIPVVLMAKPKINCNSGKCVLTNTMNNSLGSPVVVNKMSNAKKYK